MSRQGFFFKAARHIRQFLRSKLYYGFLHGVILRRQAKAKHRALLQNAQRSDSHTYTSFYRSPAQLAALTGPVVDHIKSYSANPISINVLAASNGAEAYTIASELIARSPGLEFSIAASDLHQDMVERGTAGVYTMKEITQGLHVPDEFIERTFDKVGNLYAVKPEIRSRVTFAQADLLDPDVSDRFGSADIVIAQNVLFHMPSDLAERAFASIVGFLRPHGALFIDGMELDMRVALTKRASLRPLRFKVKEIYEYSRRHIPENWWDYYYGNEPYSFLSKERVRRYATIFFND